jgi:hypothetical protein
MADEDHNENHVTRRITAREINSLGDRTLSRALSTLFDLPTPPSRCSRQPPTNQACRRALACKGQALKRCALTCCCVSAACAFSRICSRQVSAAVYGRHLHTIVKNLGQSFARSFDGPATGPSR